MKISFISNLKMPVCALKWDGLVLRTIRYAISSWKHTKTPTTNTQGEITNPFNEYWQENTLFSNFFLISIKFSQDMLLFYLTDSTFPFPIYFFSCSWDTEKYSLTKFKLNPCEFRYDQIEVWDINLLGPIHLNSQFPSRKKRVRCSHE